MYTARRGGGAFCNGEPIRVSSQEGERLACAPAGGARAPAAPDSCTFSTRRHQPVTGSDRDGLQGESRAFQNHAGQHPRHPDHPRARVCVYADVHPPSPGQVEGPGQRGSLCPVSLPSIRCPGSAAVNMCLVACGSADAYYHMGIHCWDMAAGAVIITEACGVVLDVSGEAAAAALHSRIRHTPYQQLADFVAPRAETTLRYVTDC